MSKQLSPSSVLTVTVLREKHGKHGSGELQQGRIKVPARAFLQKSNRSAIVGTRLARGLEFAYLLKAQIMEQVGKPYTLRTTR